MTTLKALFSGVHSTNRSYRMVALLYAFDLLIAAILAYGFRSVLIATIGDSMSLEHLIKDFDYTVYTDYMFKYGGRVSALISQIYWLMFFYLLLNTLLGGGTIATLKDGAERFSMRSFFENCGAYFFRFLRLLLIFGVILILLGATLSAVFGGVYTVLTQDSVSEVWPFSLAIILFLLFLFIEMLVVLMADYAKVATVANDATSMLKMSWQSIKFVFRHFVSTVGLQLSILVSVLAAVIVYLILEDQIGMATPLAVIVMFLVQQASVGFKVWARVLTFAGELELFKKFEKEASLPVPAPVVPGPTPEPVAPPVMPSAAPAATESGKKKRKTRRPPLRRTAVRRKRTSKKSK